MSFDRTYPHRKDWREPYRGRAAIDASCRPGGDCPWCQRDREHSTKRRQLRAEPDETEQERDT